MDKWKLWNSGVQAPAYNMAADEMLLETVESIGQPVFRFYGWTEPAATFGYFQKYDEIARATLLRPMIRRPTGGGLVPHDSDWTYSAAFPPSHNWYSLSAIQSYEKIHQWLCDSFKLMGIETTLSPCCIKEVPGQCFIGAEKYDLLWHGKKIAGAAQRRTKNALLIQGSIQPPPIRLTRKEWESSMLKTGTELATIDWEDYHPTSDAQIKLQNLIQTRYSLPSYNEKR